MKGLFTNCFEKNNEIFSHNREQPILFYMAIFAEHVQDFPTGNCKSCK